MSKSRPTIKADDIRERTGLQATVRPESVFTYDEKRPDYMERPEDIRSNPWMQLSRSLSEFDEDLSKYVNHRIEGQIEEDMASGADYFHQLGTDPTTGNKLAFKDLVEKHPEYAGWNPHLQKGYESARLKSLGLDYKTGLQDAYTKQGLINETDPAKVAAFVDQFDADFRKQNGLNEYNDKLLLAESFSKESYRAKQTILARHNSDFAEENVKKAVTNYSGLISKTIESTIDDINVNFADPVTRERVTPLIAERLKGIVDEASLNGLPSSHIPTMVANAVTALAHERGYTGHGDEVLTLLDHLEVNGTKLGDLPEVKGKVETLKRSFVEQQRSDQNWEDSQREKRLRDAERGAIRMATVLAAGEAPVTFETLRAKGVDPLFMARALQTAESIRKSREVDVVWDANTSEEYTLLKLKAQRGELTERELATAARRFGKHIDGVTSVYMNTIDNQDQRFTETLKSGGSKLFTMLTGKNEDALTSALDPLNTGRGPEVMKAIEAIEVFNTLFTQKYGEVTAKKKASGLLPSELEFIKQEAIAEVMRDNRYSLTPPLPVQPPTPPQSMVPQSTQAVVEVPTTVKTSRLLGESPEEFQSAVREFVEAKDKKSTKLMQAAAAQGINTPEGAKAFLAAQSNLYNIVVAGSPGLGEAKYIDPSLAIHQKLQGKFTWYTRAYDMAVDALKREFNVKQNLRDSIQGFKDDYHAIKQVKGEVVETMTGLSKNRHKDPK